MKIIRLDSLFKLFLTLYFKQWLEKTQTAIASEDHPSSLVDAERLLAQHESLQEEVAHAKPRYQNLKEEGEAQV